MSAGHTDRTNPNASSASLAHRRPCCVGTLTHSFIGRPFAACPGSPPASNGRLRRGGRTIPPLARLAVSSLALGLSDLPDVLGRPPAGPPVRPQVRIGGRDPFGRLDLDQVLDEQPIAPKQADPLTVRQLVLHQPVVVFEPSHPEVRPLQLLLYG